MMDKIVVTAADIEKLLACLLYTSELPTNSLV